MYPFNTMLAGWLSLVFWNHPQPDYWQLWCEQTMRSDVASLTAVQNSLDRSTSATDVAVAAGQSISDLLTEMKAKALAASDESLDQASRDAYNADFVALRDQIANIVSNATFNGINLIDGSTATVQALANAAGDAFLTVTARDLSLGGSYISVGTTDTISSATDASFLTMGPPLGWRRGFRSSTSGRRAGRTCPARRGRASPRRRAATCLPCARAARSSRRSRSRYAG